MCDPIDGSPPGSPVPGILQARTMEWVAISFSNAWKWIVKVKLLSHVRPSVTQIGTAAAAAQSLQSCLTLCDPKDGSPPGSPIPGIFQARTLEWVAISFSKAGKWKVKVKSLSRVPLFKIPWTTAYQAPPSMGFSRQEYWSGLPLPNPYFQMKEMKVNNLLEITKLVCIIVKTGLGPRNLASEPMCLTSVPCCPSVQFS